MSDKSGNKAIRIRKKKGISIGKKSMQDKIREFYDNNINAYTTSKATGHSKDAVYGYYAKWDKELEQLSPINSLIARDNEKIKAIQQLDEIRMSLQQQLERIKLELVEYNNKSTVRAAQDLTIYKTNSYFLENKKSELEDQLIRTLDLRTSIAMLPPSQAILLQHITDFNQITGNK